MPTFKKTILAFKPVNLYPAPWCMGGGGSANAGGSFNAGLGCGNSRLDPPAGTIGGALHFLSVPALESRAGLNSGCLLLLGGGGKACGVSAVGGFGRFESAIRSC